VADKHKRRLDRRFKRFETGLPDRLGRVVRSIREPGAHWIRIPVGILLVVAGFFGFLPILGLWMIPLGLLLLAQDVGFLRRPTGAALIRLERRWLKWRRKRQSE
jgi:hypothetical protein